MKTREMSPRPIRCSRNCERCAPHSRWGAAARKESRTLMREKYPETFGLNTVTAISDEADQLAREREHAAAEVLYKKLLNQDLGPILRLQNLTKLTDLYLSIRKRNEAMPLLEEIVRDFPGRLGSGRCPLSNRQHSLESQ